MSKIYVVTQIHWEYNDEWHYVGEGGEDGTPHKAFKDQKKADDLAKQENLKVLKDLGDELFTRYVENVDDYVNNGVDFPELIREIGGKVDDGARWSGDRYSLPSKMTDEKWEKLYDALSIRWWKVIPLEAE